MINRLTNLFLLVLIILACYWLWKRPEIRNDTRKIENAISALPDKAVDAAAKISNKIDDAKIPEKTEKAWDKAKEEAKETKENIKQNFEDAKQKDREKQ